MADQDRRLTDVEATVLVRDTESGATQIYTNLQGQPFAPIRDIGSFPTCP